LSRFIVTIAIGDGVNRVTTVEAVSESEAIEKAIVKLVKQGDIHASAERVPDAEVVEPPDESESD
jgi:hypothetical protein